MKEFNNLRTLARTKRDKLIAEARSEYEAALVQIARLEQDLLGKVASNYRKISAAIESVIPSDRPFTTVDILAGLEALDPGRVWRKRSIDNHLSRLRERGLVKRITRHTLHDRAVYARADLRVAVDDKPLLGYLREALTRPMTVTELAVAVLEAGFKTCGSKRELRSRIARELREGGFKRDGEKWA